MKSTKLLSIACWVVSAVFLVSYYAFPFSPDFIQTAWDYVIDPVVMALLLTVIVVNIRFSLQRHEAGRGKENLYMDILTMLGAAFTILYLHQYALKIAVMLPGSYGGIGGPSQFLWDLLVPGVVVFMVVSAIHYRRRSESNE